MADRTTVIPLIRLITLATGLIIGGGVSASVVEVNTQTLPVIGHAPVVTDVQFDNKTPAVNDTVKATPAITDEDNDKLETPRYQWRLDGVDIPNATQDSYKLVPGDGNGRQLSVVFTPQTDPATTEPAIGQVFTPSSLTTKGSAPEALDVRKDGKVETGELVTGNYRYHDADGPSDSEGSTSFEWQCLNKGNPQVLATSKTYRIRDADIGCLIYFYVPPRSLSGTPNIGNKAKSSGDYVIKILPSSAVRIFNGNKIGDRGGNGYNFEIDYSQLGYHAPASIIVSEYNASNNNRIGQDTYKVGTSSGVTDNGHSIKYGTFPHGSRGDTIYLIIDLEYDDMPFARGTTSNITLR